MTAAFRVLTLTSLTLVPGGFFLVAGAWLWARKRRDPLELPPSARPRIPAGVYRA